MSLNTTLRPVAEPLGGALINLDTAAAGRARKSIVQNLADVEGWEAPEHGSERYRMLEAALASRGIAYRHGGGDGHHDAWSLVRDCAQVATQRDGIDVTRWSPGFGGVKEQCARMALTQWGLVEVKERHAAPGDVVLFSIEGGVHAAVISAPGGDLVWPMLPGKKPKSEFRMIHAPGRAVTEAFAGPYWTAKMLAVFSFDGGQAPARPLRLAAA